MDIKYTGKDVVVSGLSNFSLDEILDCGQCFRWTKNDEIWSGVVDGVLLKARQRGDSVTFFDCTEEIFESIIRPYFDFDRDYSQVLEMVLDDEILKDTAAYAPGIRILKQHPFETIATFIISSNNNIKRIKGIVSRFCENFGQSVDGHFCFPTPQDLEGVTVKDLAVLRCGFRDKYLVDLVKKVNSGEVDLDAVYNMTLVEGREHLMLIKGVGPKVADCALLFGYGKTDAFPMDVWMKRAMAKLYPEGLPEKYLDIAGIVQQYIFHYARTGSEDFK